MDREAGGPGRAAAAVALLACALGWAAPAAAGQAAAAPQPPVHRLPPLPRAAIDDALVIGGEDIDAAKVRTRMTVAVGINGRGPFRFVVDSGADTSVIGRRAADALGLPAGTPVTLHGMTASGRVDRVRVGELALGGSSFRDLHLPVLRDRDLGGEGMIGIDALVRQRLLLDFEKRVINVEDARRPVRGEPGDVVVVARSRRGQLILTEAAVNRRPVEAVIDTGSEITIGNLALRDRLARRHGDKFRTVAVTGVTGVTIDMRIVRVGELKLGSVVFRDVLVAFADVPPFALFELQTKPALLLGTDLMETFRRVSLDFRARRVRFQLRRCGAASPVLSTSPAFSTSRLYSTDSVACRR